MVNVSSISRRLQRLDECIRRLKARQDVSVAAYDADWETQDIVERNFSAVRRAGHGPRVAL